jgi:hypothetical protein
MGKLLGKTQCPGALRVRLGGMSSHPQRPGIIAKTCHTRVYTAIAIGQHVVLLRIIEGNCLLQVRASQGGVAEIKPTDPDRQMRLQEECRLLDALGELEALLA